MQKRPSARAESAAAKERLRTEGRTATAIGERLELTRAVLGLTQRAFAGEAGVKESTYSQYKTGTQTPDLENANKLCDRWQLTLDWIYRGEASGLDPDLHEAIKRVRQARPAT